LLKNQVKVKSVSDYSGLSKHDTLKIEINKKVESENVIKPGPLK